MSGRTAAYWKAVGRAHGLHDAATRTNLSEGYGSQSIPLIFGSWAEATSRNLKAYDEGYRAGLDEGAGHE